MIMKNDSNTTFEVIKNELDKFREERDWAQFHDLKNLAEAISIEAGELQEIFLWKDKSEIAKKLKKDKTYKQKMAEELADVLIFCFNFASSAKLDVTTIINRKIAHNAKKYPVEISRGSAKKYNER